MTAESTQPKEYIIAADASLHFKNGEGLLIFIAQMLIHKFVSLEALDSVLSLCKFLGRQRKIMSLH